MTVSEHTTFTSCAHPGCEMSFPNHRWGAIKAHSTGWFMAKDDQAWCPEHLPEWVPQWRANPKRRK